MRKMLFLLMALLVAATACGDDDSPSVRGEPSATAEVMAAAAFELVTVDHTFGDGPSPFTTYLVLDSTDPTAGLGGGERRPLSDSERSAIEARLEQLGEVTWIADAADYRTDDLRPTIEGAVIVGLGEPEIDGATALEPVSLWCGGVCGTWFTYTLEMDADGAWAVTGIDGPIAIS